eukprot:403369302
MVERKKVAFQLEEEKKEEKNESRDPGFENISKIFSSTDIRTVYAFGKLMELDISVHILKEKIQKDVKLLEEELSIIAQLDHPNINKFYEAYIDYRYVHIVLELSEGGELFEKIVEYHRFDENEAASLIRKIISVIKHLHVLGICHRDLKPENFLFSDKSENAEIKLIDFGLSKRYGEILESNPTEQMHTIVGTPYYVAPEVLKGKYNYQCDIWSIGIILYIMLCGYPPFEGDDNKEIFRRVLQQKLEFDPEDWGDISDDAKDLVSKMLLKDPIQRISAGAALSHRWLKPSQARSFSFVSKITQQIKDFRTLQPLQVEVLTFLVNNLQKELDLKNLRDAFRALDQNDTGFLTLNELRQASFFNNFGQEEEEDVNDLFMNLDLNNDEKISYSNFLAATVDKTKALTVQNLNFAFHHFDADNSGFITEGGLSEVFYREGRKNKKEQIDEIMKHADPEKKGRISYVDFNKIMKSVIDMTDEQLQ